MEKMPRSGRNQGQAVLPKTPVHRSRHHQRSAVTVVSPQDLACVPYLLSPPGPGTTWRIYMDWLAEAAGGEEVAPLRSPQAAGGLQIPENTAAGFSAMAAPRPLHGQCPHGTGAASQ